MEKSSIKLKDVFLVRNKIESTFQTNKYLQSRRKRKKEKLSWKKKVFWNFFELEMNENCEDVIVPGQGLRRVNILDLQIAIGFSGEFYHEEILIFTVYLRSTVEAA